MRLIKEIPEVEEKIERGEISLSVASQMQTFFRMETQQRREKQISPFSREEKLGLINKLTGTSARQCEKKLAQIAPETALPKEKTRPISEEKVLVQLVAGKNLMGNLERLKGLLSHQNPGGSLEKLLEKITEIALDKLDPERREARRQKRAQSQEGQENPGLVPTSAPNGKIPSRHIPSPLRDRVWLRDQGQCQYRDPVSGKLCGSRQFAQVDHRFPFALGGENSETNLQLRCTAHNQLRAKELTCPGSNSTKSRYRYRDDNSPHLLFGFIYFRQGFKVPLIMGSPGLFLRFNKIGIKDHGIRADNQKLDLSAVEMTQQIFEVFVDVHRRDSN